MVQDPETVSRLREALMGSGDPGWRVQVGRHGTVTCMAPHAGGVSRRVLEFDRSGTLLTAACWNEAGRLRRAKLKLPDGRWVGVEPRSADSPLWGKSDRLWLLDGGAPFSAVEALSDFQAVDYGAVAAIPPLAEPHRLPPGAGTAVLNFLACLLVDQGSSPVHYRGPYATEQLFTALLESFGYDPLTPDPLARFLQSDLPWTPAPHERSFRPRGLYVQLRDGVEKVVFRGKAYYRRQWQTVTRNEPRVIREVEGRVICSLWALGRPVEDHLLLDPGGELVEVLDLPPEDGPVEPLSAPWRAALGALLAQQSAPALAPWIEEALQEVSLEWGPVSGDLLAVDGQSVRLTLKLPRLFSQLLAGCQGEGERLALALALVVEISRLLGPTLRLQAQGLLASLPAPRQRAALESPAAPPSLTSVEKLARALAAGEGC